MSAVIRVKRHCDEEPIDTLILNCKRRKTEENQRVESTVLKFAGTLENQEDDIFKHINKPTKVELEENYKKHFSTIRDKLREQIQESSKSNRYKVVNLCRTNHAPDDAASERSENDTITIVDIETNSENKEDEKDTSKYVYDLYYTSSDDLADVYDHDLVGIYPLSDTLVYGSYRDNGVMESEDTESDDSNDENNWRNDYPEEEDGSINEEDMLAAVNRMNLEEENNLSSDEGEEGFIYSIDSEAAGFEEDIDDSDVNRYGERYARFRARYLDKSTVSEYCGDYEDEDTSESYY